jgi:hypothetical protein
MGLPSVTLLWLSGRSALAYARGANACGRRLPRRCSRWRLAYATHSRISGRSGSSAQEGIELSVDLRAADEGTIARDLSKLLLQLGRAAADKGTGVVFLLDEVQFVKEVEYRSVITALHRAAQKNVPITLAAAGLPQIPRLTGEARSYAERLFSFPVISSLSASDATAALVEPARQQHVEYEPEAIELALAWTGGYPFYIQQLGKHAWNLANTTPITTLDLEAAMPAAQQALDSSIYEVRIQRATDQERRYMRAMAELGSGPYRSGDVASKLGRKTSEGIGGPPATPGKGTRVRHRGLRLRRLHGPAVRGVHGSLHAVSSTAPPQAAS